MSEPATFVVIREGEKRFYLDQWAHSFLYRNLIWGPEALDQWLADEDEIAEWEDEVCGGVVVDHDNRRLVWDGDDHDLDIPRVAAVLHHLLQTSWDGYQIEYATRGIHDLAKAAGEIGAAEGIAMMDAEFLADRPETVREAAGFYDDEGDLDEDDDEGFDDEDFAADDDGEIWGEDEARAWITLIDENGAVRHRQLNSVSQDLFSGEKDAIQMLLGLDAAEVPAEKAVREGIWFDFGKRRIGFWGSPTSMNSLPFLRQGWDGWDVNWADGGYAEQCGVSGPSGIPMSDAEALAKLTPKILSTKRIDMGTILGALGGSLKKTAIKGVGCLATVLSLPVLLFGLIAGEMQAALITIAIVWVGFAIAFKFVESRFKKKFSDGLEGSLGNQVTDADLRPPVAGPINAKERSIKLDQLFADAGFPSLAVVTTHVDEDDTIEGVL